MRLQREESDHRPPSKSQTRSDTRKRQHARPSQPVMKEDCTDSSTDSEYVRPTRRSYRAYLKDILDRRRAAQGRAVVSPDEEEPLGVSIDQGTSSSGRTAARPKRLVKPVVRLAYDELGKASDRPITIVHRGVTIRIDHN